VTPRLAAALCFALTLAAAGAALAQAEGTKILFDLQVVKGSNEIVPARQDPACDELKRRLPMQFSSLEMLAQQRLDLGFGEAGSVRLPSGRPVTLLPISIVRGLLHVHFRMDGLVDTRLQMRSGRPVIVGGESYEQGQIIIMLTPSYEHSPKPAAKPRGPELHRVGHKK
jgi:hypothetical protein